MLIILWEGFRRIVDLENASLDRWRKVVALDIALPQNHGVPIPYRFKFASAKPPLQRYMYDAARHRRQSCYICLAVCVRYSWLGVVH